MKHIVRSVFLFATFFLTTNAFSQLANGEWRDHLAYINGIGIAAFENKVFCASSSGIFYYDKRDQSITKISKVNGLNDVGITSIGADTETGHLIIAYKNGGIDIFNNKDFFYLTDIKRKNILGDKQINKIVIHDQLAYLATGFGIVVLDYLKREIKDTYIFGPDGTNITVNDIEIIDNQIYAATAKGVYLADLTNPNLVNYNFWDILTALPFPNANYSHIEISSDKNHWFAALRNEDNNKDDIYYLQNDTWSVWENDLNERYHDFFIYNNLVYYITFGAVSEYNLSTGAQRKLWGGLPRKALLIDDEVWAADLKLGLIHFMPGNRIEYAPNGPNSNEVHDINVNGTQVLTAKGSVTSNYNNVYFSCEFFKFNNEQWSSYIIPEARDAIAIVSNPRDPGHFYGGTWGHGIYEYRNNELVDSFTIHNSEQHTLQTIFQNQNFIRIGGMAFDSDGNLWVTNAGVENTISVRDTEGNWTAFKYDDIVDAPNVADIIITNSNHKWVQVPNGEGIFVFNDNGTIDDNSDDQVRKLSIIDRDENKSFNDVYSLAEDLDGDIWVGTNQGPLVYYNPESVFDDANIRADRIVLPIEIAGEGSYLLSNSTITSIAVDGANRKWLGTAHSGAFLMSANGKKEIHHFTKDNSPLLSNQIKKIAINHENGEVFFATPEGLVSYMGDATGAGEFFENVYVFPNPVREDYSGDITITGLARNVIVKITDISGNIVYETTSLGGQAIWNGKNFDNQKVQTGVYLVFCTSDDGSQTHITKLLFIH